MSVVFYCCIGGGGRGEWGGDCGVLGGCVVMVVMWVVYFYSFILKSVLEFRLEIWFEKGLKSK